MVGPLPTLRLQSVCLPAAPGTVSRRCRSSYSSSLLLPSLTGAPERKICCCEGFQAGASAPAPSAPNAASSRCCSPAIAGLSLGARRPCKGSKQNAAACLQASRAQQRRRQVEGRRRRQAGVSAVRAGGCGAQESEPHSATLDSPCKLGDAPATATTRLWGSDRPLVMLRLIKMHCG